MTRQLPEIYLLTILMVSISGCVVVTHDTTGLGGASGFEDEELTTGSPLGSDDADSNGSLSGVGKATGGATGSLSSGGTNSTGGTSVNAPSTGGMAATGGASPAGGSSSTGGAPSTGGASASGGSDMGTGGALATGGAAAGGGSGSSCGGTVSQAAAQCGDLILFEGKNYICTSQAAGVNGEAVGCGTVGVYCNNIAPSNAAWGSVAWSETDACL